MLKSVRLPVLVIIPLLGAGCHPDPGETRYYGPFPGRSADSGTCANNWSMDRYDRVFGVETQPDAAGVYRFTEGFQNGTFVTVAGPSPGGCDTDPGGMVNSGLTGTLQGSFIVEIATGAFNADATCPDVCTTDGFIRAVFGEAATFTVPSWYFLYSSAGKNGTWRNASPDWGGNSGDITGGIAGGP